MLTISITRYIYISEEKGEDGNVYMSQRRFYISSTTSKEPVPHITFQNCGLDNDEMTVQDINDPLIHGFTILVPCDPVRIMQLISRQGSRR